MADTVMTTVKRLHDEAIRKMNAMPNSLLMTPDTVLAGNSSNQIHDRAIRDVQIIERRAMRDVQAQISENMRIMADSMAIFDFSSPFDRLSVRPPFFVPAREVPSLPSGPPPAPPVARAIAAPVGEIDPELLAHEALAKKLGITCVAPEIGVQRLRQVLADEGITCYDRKAVEDYLTVMAARAQAEIGPGQWGVMTWAWFPARKLDVSLPKVTGEASTVYDSPDHPIPLPALMTMDRIVGRLGDQVRFLVGAITKGDPFLAVVARGSDALFPIERWDAPGFRGIASPIE